MSNFLQFNKDVIDWGIDTSNYPIVSLLECASMGYDVICVKGFFFHNSLDEKKQALLITDRNFILSIPVSYTEVFERIRQDLSLINDIKENKCFIQIYTYENKKYKKICGGIKFVEPKEYKIDKVMTLNTTINQMSDLIKDSLSN